MPGDHYQDDNTTSRRPNPRTHPAVEGTEAWGFSVTTSDMLKQRGLDPMVASRMGVVTSPQGEPTFLYREASGEVVNVKRITTKGGKRAFKTIEGNILPMWNASMEAPDAPFRLVITEGEFDAIAIAQSGLPHVVSVPNGASSSPSNYLWSIEHLIEDPNCTSVIIAVDGDEPGNKLESALADAIGRERCERVRWPEGIKDANDLLKAQGAEALYRVVIDAEPFPVVGIVKPMDVIAELMQLRRREVPRGESTGWTLFDELYTIKLGQLTVVTGSPMSGKSEFIDALMVNLARDTGMGFAVYSPEYYPVERYVQKWIEKYSQTNYYLIEEQHIQPYTEWVQQHLSVLYPDQPTIPALLDLARVECIRSDIQGLVIDPWSETEHDRPAGMTETEWIGKMLTDIRDFARMRNIHVWVIAHPTKNIRNNDTGEYGVVTPYDISGSAHWFNKSDSILSVWRDRADEEKPVQVHVQKIRYREVGRLGMCEFEYDRRTGVYRDIATTFPDGNRKTKNFGW